jgi:hypothetical protein
MYDDEVNYDDNDDYDADRYLYHLCYCCNNKVNSCIRKQRNWKVECSRR